MKGLIRACPSLLMVAAWYSYFLLLDSIGIKTLGATGWDAITLLAWMSTFVLASRFRNVFLFGSVSKFAFLPIFFMLAILVVIGVNAGFNKYVPGYVLRGTGKLLLIEEPLRGMVQGLAIAAIMSFPMVVVYGRKAALALAIMCLFPELSLAYKSSLEFNPLGMFWSVYIFLVCPLATLAPIWWVCLAFSRKYANSSLKYHEAAN